MKTEDAKKIAETALELYGAYGSRGVCLDGRDEDERRLRRRRLKRMKSE